MNHTCEPMVSQSIIGLTPGLRRWRP